MNNTKKIREQDVAFIDNRVCNFIRFMCKKCKFYNGKCTKGRIVEKCAMKNLKNID